MNGEQLTCEHAGDECNGELRTYLWYDIFSDDPKGVITLCEHHDGYYGSPDEGFFYCDSCNRTMIENYTWELYRHVDEGGEICLKCYAEQEIANDENWIVLTPENIAAVTFEQVRAAKHLLAVDQPTPEN